MATVQLRNPTEGAYSDHRKKASGKTSMEAMRCLKPRLSDIVYRTMLTDSTTWPCRRRAGRTPGNDPYIQRGQLASPHRLFRKVTSEPVTRQRRNRRRGGF